jgi:hypothetical protein
MGIFSATNVTTSIIVDNVSVTGMYSEPYLPNDTRSFTSDILDQPGRAIFKVNKLLPHASMTLHITMNASGFENAKLLAYVQSDETIGYHGILYVILAYFSVAFTLAFISMFIFTVNRKKYHWVGVWGPAVICIILTSLFLSASLG